LQLRRALAQARGFRLQRGDGLLPLAQHHPQLVAVARALLEGGAALHRLQQLRAQRARLALHLRRLHAAAQRLLARRGELRFQLRHALLLVRGPGAIPEVGQRETRHGAQRRDDDVSRSRIHAPILACGRLTRRA
jgi:hypothetical protein